MKPACRLMAVMMLCCLFETGCNAGAGEYLAQDGMLARRVEVQDLQGGFVGLTGSYWAIEQDGSWNSGPLLPPTGRKGAARERGVIGPENLARLSGDFARCDLAGLGNYGRPSVNPHVIRILFGERVSELMPGMGASSPGDDRSIRARYRCIVQAVMEHCGKTKK